MGCEGPALAQGKKKHGGDNASAKRRKAEDRRTGGNSAPGQQNPVRLLEPVARRPQRSLPQRDRLAPHRACPSLGRHHRAADDPRRHSWRLAGTGIARLWGAGLTGKEVAENWPVVYRRALERGLDGVCERRQPFVARLKAQSETGEVVGIELFAAPVEAGDSAAVQTLCTVVPFREPQWLGRTPLVKVELTTLTAIGAVPLPDEIKSVRPRSTSLELRLVRGGRSD